MGFFDPLDFLNIPRYLNDLDKCGSLKSIPRFHEYEDIVAKYITKFTKFIVVWDIMDEDIRMRLFVIFIDLQNN